MTKNCSTQKEENSQQLKIESEAKIHLLDTIIRFDHKKN
jgi:hypothetical protein